MSKMNIQTEYVDIMAPRRAESSVFQFMSRPWSPKKTMDLAKCLKPQQLKEATESSVYINDIIESISISTGVSKEKLKNEVKKYLEEMGLDRKICRVRWVGVAFLKISFMMKISVFVNEAAVFDLKQTMGTNPVLFLPTHRSYADFCLMTYLCYHYDIDLPAVAAGMDFYSMAVVGRAMRDTCAFYIRRTLAGSPLYAATLRQYVRTLVARHPAPVEFFVEATRSRSNKSLHPKYGMLSMSLLPLFSGEVADVTVVPVNISYDRLMEHGLFAYEHLGVPKPKESTGGFLKAISRLNDHFGNIYMSLGEPFSVKQYLEENHKMAPLKPTLLTDVNAQQFTMVQDLAHYVVSLQQRCTVHTITNLVALVLMQSVVRNVSLHYKEVLQEIQYMIAVLRSLGCTVFENDVKTSVDKLLMVHKSMMKFDREDRLRLLSSDPMVISEDIKKKMKGHTLSVETMVTAVPVIQLQLYVNPTLPWLVPPALLAGLARRGPAGIEQLSADYHRLRKLFKYEFYYYDKEEQKTLQRAIDFCLEYKVLVKVNDQFSTGDDERLQFLLKWAAWPALDTMLNCIEVLKQKAKWEQKGALRNIQQEGESRRRHPYCLSLEAATNCLQGLAHVAAIRRVKSEEVNYEVDESLLNDYHSLVKSVTPTFNVDFDRNNTVILDQRVFPSRL